MTDTVQLHARIDQLAADRDALIRLRAEGLLTRTALDAGLAEIGRRLTAAQAALQSAYATGGEPDDGGFLFARTPPGEAFGSGAYAAAEAGPAKTYSVTVGKAGAGAADPGPIETAPQGRRFPIPDEGEFVLDVLSAGDRLAEIISPATLEGQRAAQHWKAASSLLRTHRAGE